MPEQERPLFDRLWDITKDITYKVSKKAEKHWKINTLRVEITSIKIRINSKYKDLGRYVYESLKSGEIAEEDYKKAIQSFYDEIKDMEQEIFEREMKIEALEQELRESGDDGHDEPYHQGPVPPMPSGPVTPPMGQSPPKSEPEEVTVEAEDPAPEKKSQEGDSKS